MKLLLVTLFVAAASAIPIPDESKPVDVIVNGLPEGAALNVESLLGVQVNEHVDGQLIAASDPLYPYSVEGVVAALEAQAAIEASLQAPVELPVIASPEIIDEQSPIVLPVPALPGIVESGVNPAPATPELIEGPSPVALPAPLTPEVVIPGILPAPATPELVVPDVVPAPATPELVVPDVLPAPATPEVVVPELIDGPQAVVLPEIIETPVVVVENAENSEDHDVSDSNKPAPVPSGEIYSDGIVQVTVNVPENAGIFATLQSWVSIAINYVSSGV